MTLTRRRLAPLALSVVACRAPVAPAVAGPLPARPAAPPLLTLTVAADAASARAVASTCGVFGRGELPVPAVLVGRCAGSRHDVPVDVSVLSTHADGSARVALLSFPVPGDGTPCAVAVFAAAAAGGTPQRQRPSLVNTTSY